MDKNTDDKIDVEELIKDFLIPNSENLSKYLKTIWKVNKTLSLIGFISKKR